MSATASAPPTTVSTAVTEDARPRERSPAGTQRTQRVGFYLWIAVVLAVAVVAVVLGWNAAGGTVDPTGLAPGQQMSRTTAVVNSAVLVFREGLETILVLAAVTASFLGANRVYRRPVAAGGVAALLASVATWFVAVWFIGLFGDGGLTVQAATGVPAIVVLLVVMNWFFHKVYWTGWISHHHKRRRSLLPAPGEAAGRSALLGLGILGFTSVYREGFEVVVFLQNLRVTFGSSVVLEGVVLGLLFTAAVGVLTFALHQRLPYKRLLVITGALLVVVLFVMVGEEVNEMQLAGWIGSTDVSWLHVPGWAGTWFSVFPNVETIVAQVAAVAIVLGSYLAAERWRSGGRRRIATAPPERATARG
ncbi:MAG TPA: FTR1 family protein [Solirubrobacteraceae bacterium]|jgi:high-affinity iron transporter|nr:FTR1 family protein [Solirubrobacteraceae bacterium]